jgi:hypothetical protein
MLKIVIGSDKAVKMWKRNAPGKKDVHTGDKRTVVIKVVLGLV